MDESEREINRKAPGVLEIDGEKNGSGKGRGQPEQPRAVSPVTFQITEDAPARSPGKDVQARKPRVSLASRETPTTDRQRRFVKQYLANGGNKVQAFLKVTPKLKRTDQSKTALEVKSRKMLNSAGVQYLLNIADDKKITGIGRALEKYAINETRIAEELAKIAFSDPTQVMSWGPDGVRVKSSDELAEGVSGTIAEVSEGNKGSIKIRQHDKLSALISLGRQLGMFSNDKSESGPKMAVQFIINKGP